MATSKGIKAGEGYVELTVPLGPLEKGLAAASEKFKQWGASLGAIGASASAIGATIVAPFYLGVEAISAWGLEMQTGMREMGIEFGALDELMDGMRVGLEQMTPAVAKMSAVMQGAANNSREAVQILDVLGLSFDELNSMTQGDRVMAFADALSRVSDAGQRIALQREVFGRGALALNITGGREGIQSRAARADVVEGVQTPAMLASARAYNAVLREMKAALGGLALVVGSAVLPAMTAVVGKMVDVVVNVRRWMEEHQNLVRGLFFAGTLLISVGAALTALGGVLWVVGAGMGSLFGSIRLVVGGLASLVMWLGPVFVAVTALRYALLFSGFYVLSYGILAAELALEAFHYTMHLVHHGFYIGAAASWVWGYAVAGATAIASTAMHAFNLVIGVLTSGFGLLTIASYAYWVGATVNSAIATAAMWAYNLAMGAGTTAVTTFSIAEFIASVATTILTSGINLLIAAVVALEGALLAVVAVSAVAIAGAILLSAAYTATASAVVGAITWMMDRTATLADIINDPWEMLVEGPALNTLEAITDAFDYLWSTVMGAWNAISGALDDLNAAFNSADMSEFTNMLFYGAIGAAGIAVALGYVVYALAEMVDWVELATNVWGVIVDTVSLKFWRDLATAIGMTAMQVYEFGVNAVQWVQDAWGEIVAYVNYAVQSVRDAINSIVEPFRALIAQFQFLGGFIGKVIDHLKNGLGGIWDAIKLLFSVDLIWNFVYNLIPAFGVIVQVIQDAISKATSIVLSMAAPIIQLGRSLVGSFLSFLGNLRGMFVTAMSGIGDSLAGLIPVAQGVWARLASGFGQTRDSFAAAFGQIVRVGHEAFDGVWYAFKVGNWELLWNIMKAAAMLAFHDLTAFVQDIWIIWRTEGEEIFNQIGDGLYAALMRSWTAVQVFYAQGLNALEILFDEAYTGIIDGFWGLAAAAINAWGTAHTFIMQSIEAITGSLGVDIANQLGLSALGSIGNDASLLVANERAANRSEGADRVAWLRDEGGAAANSIRTEAWFNNAIAEVSAEMRADAARQAADLERRIAAEGNAGTRAGLQREIDALNMQSLNEWIDQEQRRMQGTGEFADGSEGFMRGGAGRASVGGTFTGAAMAGLYGGSESPANRMVRQQELQRQVLLETQRLNQEMLAELRRMGGFV